MAQILKATTVVLRPLQKSDPGRRVIDVLPLCSAILHGVVAVAFVVRKSTGNAFHC